MTNRDINFFYKIEREKQNLLLNLQKVMAIVILTGDTTTNHGDEQFNNY